MIFYIAQVVGFIGLLFAFISFQKNHSKGILLFQVMAAFVFVVHFALLGAYTGAVMNLLGAARNLVFYNREKSWADKKSWLYGFIAMIAIAGIFTWKNSFSILPVIAGALSTIGLWNRNSRYTRFIILFSAPCWLIYNIATSSVAGILTEAFVLSSLLVGIIRFDILKLPEKNRLL